MANGFFAAAISSVDNISGYSYKTWRKGKHMRPIAVHGVV